METITSKNNQTVKELKKLTSSSKLRREQHLFVLEGARSVFDALNSQCEVKYFLITQNAFDKYTESANLMLERSEKSYLITDIVAFFVSDTQSSQGIFAVCKMTDSVVEYTPDGKYIILDNVRDPGNVGTIIRTAEALGINAVVACGSCEIYNPKVLRSSMGSVLRMKIDIVNELESVIGNMKAIGIKIYGTSPDRNLKKITDVNFHAGCACVIGNEANGLSDETVKICDELITIPMQGRAESLNASAAAALTMWEMLR